MRRVAAVARDRSEVVCLVAILVATQLLPKATPAGIYTLGGVAGATLALHGVGLVMIYRANRIINFAQVAVGSVAALFFVIMVRYRPVLRGISSICSSCFERVTFRVLVVNWVLSLVLALLLAAVLSLCLFAVVHRLRAAPRLAVTIATVFLAQTLVALQSWVAARLTTEEQRERGLDLGPVPMPFEMSITISPARFEAPQILAVVVAVVAIAGLAVYLRRSRAGVAVRGAADMPARVETLGVDVRSVTSKVWVLAGLLSAAAGLTQAMASGVQGQDLLSAPTLVRVLAVAVLARMTSLPLAAAAALVIGMLDQAVLWSYGTTVVLDGLLLFVIGIVLVVQRARLSRAELEQASSWSADREARPIPPELRSLPPVRAWLRRGALGLGAVVLLSPWALSAGQIDFATRTMLMGLLALSLLVLTGWAGQISLGQFAFAAVGAYVTAVLGLPFPLSLVVAAAAGAAVATVVGIPALRLRGLHLAITTLAFALTTTSLLLNQRYFGRFLPSELPRPRLLGIDLADGRVLYYVTLTVLFAGVLFAMGVRRSRSGRALIACRENEAAAQSFGINLVRVRLSAFAVSGGMAAVAGGLLAYQESGVKVVAFPAEASVELFLVAVVGGFGSLAGPLLGALYFGTEPYLSEAVPVLGLLYSGVGGLLLIAFVGGGLDKLVFRARDGWLRRVARRYGIIVPSLLADASAATAEERVPIAPRSRSGGGTVYVPRRYRVGEQWALDEREEVVRSGLSAAMRSLESRSLEAAGDASHRKVR